MTGRPYATCILGFGKIAAGYAHDPVMARHYRYTTHSQVLRVHPRFKWTAACDSESGPRDAALALDSSIEVAGTPAELKVGRDAEVLVLAIPPGPERLSALENFPRLRAVMVEKPLGRSPEEARRFIEACNARNILVQVALWRRADPLLRSLASGELTRLIGDLQTGYALYGNGLHNNGVHMVDLIRMLCGEIAAVSAIGAATQSSMLPIPGDTQVDAALTLASGANIFMASLDFKQYREVGLDLWGASGRLSIWQEGLYVAHYSRSPNRAMRGEHEIASDAATLMPSTVGEAFWHLYDDLAQSLDNGTPLCSPASSALVSTNVIDGIFESTRTGARRTFDQ